MNQSAPSGPVAIPLLPLEVGTGYSVIVPAVVIRPIELPDCSVNHKAPSGPAATLFGIGTLK